MPETGNDNYIFRRAHRRLTLYTNLALLPALITAAAALLSWLTRLTLGDQTLEFILGLPAWLLAIIWFALPLLSVFFSRRARERGTLYDLRKWNSATYMLGLLLLLGETLIIATSLF